MLIATATVSTCFATNSCASFKMCERVMGQPVIKNGSFGQGVSFIVLRYVILKMFLSRIWSPMCPQSPIQHQNLFLGASLPHNPYFSLFMQWACTFTFYGIMPISQNFWYQNSSLHTHNRFSLHWDQEETEKGCPWFLIFAMDSTHTLHFIRQRSVQSNVAQGEPEG